MKVGQREREEENLQSIRCSFLLIKPFWLVWFIQQE